MTHKLSTALMALSMIIVAACNDDAADEKCTPEERQCKGDEILKICGQNGIWHEIECQSPAVCKLGANQQYACINDEDLINSQNNTIGAPCDQTEYRQSCVDEGKGALICWNRKVVRWDCESCDPQSADPLKPLMVNCVRGNTNSNANRPDNVPEKCVKGESKGICGKDGNAWFCGTDNTYYLSEKGTCTDGKSCIQCDNGYIGCGKTESDVCKSGSGDIDTTAPRPQNVPESCVKGESEALCGEDGNAWFCGTNGYYLSESGKCKDNNQNCIKCKNKYVGCGDDELSFCNSSSKDWPNELKNKACDPNKSDEKAVCGSDGNLWLCGDYGYYMPNSGKCKEQSLNCIKCKNDYSGCGTDELSFCNSSSKDWPNELKNKTCSASNSNEKAVCGSDGNMWVCGDYGYYLPNSGKCKANNKNCIKCKNDYTGCGTDETSFCNPSAANVPDNLKDGCEKQGNNQDKKCGDDRNLWVCGDYGYTLPSYGKCVEKNQQCFVCDKTSYYNAGCATSQNALCNSSSSQRPSNVPENCTKGTDKAKCGSDGNVWYCGDYGYFLIDSGKCAKGCTTDSDGKGVCN